MDRVVVALLILIAGLGLAGCATTAGSGDSGLAKPGHGGGVALFASGEYVTIGENGEVVQRCYLCGAKASTREACELEARGLDIPMCETQAVSPDALERSKTLRGHATPRQSRSTLTCQAWFMRPPPGHFGTLPFRGDLCQMTSQFTCFCVVP